MSESGYYLGFDLSTQQLKCLAIDDQLNIVTTAAIEFDKDFPHYNTRKGVYIKDEGVIDAPVAMWLEAIDLCFERLGKCIDLKKVKSMSGSCQQHGTVFWNCDHLPKDLQPSSNLVKQLASCFSRDVAPNWQDHSTRKQCDELTDKVGGPQELARITGSSSHYRFSGSQIAKVHETEPEVYANTKKISLVSSFLASVLVGDIVPLEEADACGMNLYGIEKHEFNEDLLSVVDEDIASIKRKLFDPPTSSDEPKSLGPVSTYFQEKYGVNPDCQIYPFTGDNLATICSLPLQKNDVLISLGTSTTILLITDQYHSSPNYHLFIHPTVPNHYMGMICYCNGSLAREKIRDDINGESQTHDWTKFNEALLDNSLSNDNEIGLYFPLGEIVPNMDAVTKRCYFKYIDNKVVLTNVNMFPDKRLDAKNIVESQALSCRVRISPLLSEEANAINETQVLKSELKVKFDYDFFPLASYAKRPNRAFFVGGASKNEAIIKTMANVIGAKNGNYRLETANSCALGGCYKALWSLLKEQNPETPSFDRWLNAFFNWERDCEFVCNSDAAKWENYNNKIRTLSEIEREASSH
ncbi:xylulokinase [Kluyveromyces lactis]|uniref:Xylulose kinase n=1 Tax=Kluyveromyces lactis (strain ATCC 8585 / CBS 2359 / DSM 70799 / NBRC 1267 / NRRL Y-1140 / WM37) TaxID=284590 RepID=Q6CNU9_KLULA|nr:uncharacterized protein KLLA0_E09769g [Kluyveromyces lactis]CAG99477.1 KLLA0E09769p [Kluyveromyces lactis]|eukprot:XP_454390.1 uncharacterized protein KLLA0_E09769g [Kluyveromyces lactis]